MILPTAQYHRDIIKTGVRTNKVGAEKTFILDAFEKDALVFFERDDFPERYVRKLYKELEKGLSAKRAIRKNNSNEFQCNSIRIKTRKRGRESKDPGPDDKARLFYSTQNQRDRCRCFTAINDCGEKKLFHFIHDALCYCLVFQSYPKLSLWI